MKQNMRYKHLYSDNTEKEAREMGKYTGGVDPDIEDWIEKYKKSLLALAFGITKSVHDANDCVQEAFIKASLKSAQLESREKIYQWLSKIVINECKALLRSKWMRSVFKTNEFSEAEYHDTHRFEISELYQCVLTLPEKYRLPIVLHYYQDFSLQEVSEILGVNESTCRVRVYRGRERLKQMFLKGEMVDVCHSWN